MISPVRDYHIPDRYHSLGDVYHDRNLLAIAFARAMQLSGEFEMAARGGWTRRD
ncbi:hypothetical protein [Haloterrigena sp. H1]|uniref:hypothetical protein n=1 Tax=Haloterrigena sp. H1 TaxID=2552943 RepID=UPI0014875EAA|nr:hypothetical protein [Haloterrigena sp. H1]